MLTLLYWICDLMSFIVSINSCLSSPQLFLLIPSVCLSHTLAPFARMPVAGTLDFLISSHSIWVLSSIFSTLFLLVSCFGNLHRATFMSSDSLAVLSLVIRLRKLSFFIYLYVYFFPPVFPTDSNRFFLPKLSICSCMLYFCSLVHLFVPASGGFVLKAS